MSQRLSLYLSRKELFIGIFLTTLLINSIAITLPLFIYHVYDRVLPFAATETLLALALLACGLFGIEFLLRCARTYVLSWEETKHRHKQVLNNFNQCIHAAPDTLSHHDPQQLIDQFYQNENETVSLYSHKIIHSIDIIFVGLYLMAIAFISWPIALVIASLQLITQTFLPHEGIAALQQNKRQRASESNVLLNDLISSIHTIKSLATEALFLRKFDQTTNKQIINQFKLDEEQARQQSIQLASGQFAIIAVIVSGSALCIFGNLTLGGLTACLLLSSRVIQPIQQYLKWRQQQNQPPVKVEAAQILSRTIPDKISGDIKISDLGCKDELANLWLFRHVNLSITSGDCLAIQSSNQAATTALLTIINGPQSPSEGHIEISGIDPKQDAQLDLRPFISYLPQHGQLFCGSIMDNITLFNHEKYQELALQIANRLGLGALVEALPMGYKTQIGLGANDHISRGMKQLILITRALMRRPRIILFDQANTALDQTADQRLTQLLNELKGQMTIILVSYRPSLLSIANKVIDLDDPKTSAMSDVA